MNIFNIMEGRTSRLVVILAVVIFLLSVLPTFSFASSHGFDDTFTGQLVPCGAQGTNDMCGYCDLFTLGQNLINFMVYLAVIIAVLLFVYAGFTFMTSAGNAGKVAQAKGLFAKAFIGLIIVLASWLLVDLMMKSFSNFGDTTAPFGPWNPICDQNNLDASIGTGAPSTSGGVIGGPGVAPDGTFTYDSGILEQRVHDSLPLSALLSCMAGKVPGDVGRISSISDSVILSGSGTFSSCASSGLCSHVANSCHYGGTSCIGSSYAVDFGDEENYSDLRAAALECNSNAYVLLESTHVHISVGADSGCGCDTAGSPPPPPPSPPSSPSPGPSYDPDDLGSLPFVEGCTDCVAIDSSVNTSVVSGTQINSFLNNKLVMLETAYPGSMLILAAYPSIEPITPEGGSLFIPPPCYKSNGNCVYVQFSTPGYISFKSLVEDNGLEVQASPIVTNSAGGFIVIYIE